MRITVSRLYPDGRLARAVVDELKAAGLPRDDIGIIAASRGAAGLLAGLSAFILPGTGAVVAAGWVADALAGGLGGGGGGIAGALVGSSVGENDAAHFADGVRRGGTLVTVRMMTADRDYYESIMATTQMPRLPVDYDRAGMPVQVREPGKAHIKP